MDKDKIRELFEKMSSKQLDNMPEEVFEQAMSDSYGEEEE